MTDPITITVQVGGASGEAVSFSTEDSVAPPPDTSSGGSDAVEAAAAPPALDTNGADAGNSADGSDGLAPPPDVEETAASEDFDEDATGTDAGDPDAPLPPEA